MPSQLLLPFWRRAAVNEKAARLILAALAVAGLLGSSAEGRAATGLGFLGAHAQSVFIGAETVNVPSLDDRLVQAGFPGVPDTVWALGAAQDWQVGGPPSPFRAGIQVALAVGEGAASPKRLRVLQGYVGPRIAYYVSPIPRFMAELAVGLGVGATAVTLIHDDAQSLQSSLSQGHESTMWRGSLVVAPEFVVGAATINGLFVELGMGYQYDIGLGGWRSAGGHVFTDGPNEGLSGVRYRLGISWRPQASVEKPLTGSEPVPWTTVLGFTVVSVDEPTAARLRLPDRRGAQVIHIAPGSPADRAGLRPDDVVRRVGSVDILSAQHLLQAIESYQPGDVVSLRVWRLETVAALVRRGRFVDVFLVLPEQ